MSRVRRGDQLTNLGSCCACGKTGPDVRNVVLLRRRSPIPGHGWGCLTCGLPSDGASAVVCDACMDADGDVVLKKACRGYPATEGRVPIEELGDEVFDHDLSKHPDASSRW